MTYFGHLTKGKHVSNVTEKTCANLKYLFICFTCAPLSVEIKLKTCFKAAKPQTITRFHSLPNTEIIDCR